MTSFTFPLGTSVVFEGNYHFYTSYSVLLVSLAHSLISVFFYFVFRGILVFLIRWFGG